MNALATLRCSSQSNWYRRMTAGWMTELGPRGWLSAAALCVYSGSGRLPAFQLPLWITRGWGVRGAPNTSVDLPLCFLCHQAHPMAVRPCPQFFWPLQRPSHLRKCLISTGSLSCRGQRSQANKLSLPSCFLPTASVLKKALFLEFLLAFICTLSN